jgi:pimeloyl-ACP methyl ester carboxylesterase/O-antigen/teichoic acid export membrane protein
MVSAGGTAIIGVVFWAFAAHLAPASVVGTTTAEIAAMVLLANLAQLSFGSIFERFLPVAGRLTRDFVFRAYVMCIVTGFVLASAYVILGLGNGYLPQSTGWKALFIVSVVLWTIFALQDSVLIGLRASPWVAVENISFSIAKLLLLPIAIAISPKEGIFAAWTAPVILTIIVITWYVFRRLIPEHVSMGGSAARLPSTRNLVGLAGAQYASMLSTVFMPSLISLIVIERLGPVANAHFYVPALIATGLSVVAMSIVRSFLVEASHEPHLLRKHAQSAMRALAILLVPSVTIGCLFAPYYLRVFGDEYSAGGTTLIRLLLLAIPGSTVMVFYSAFAWLDQRVWWMSIRIFIGSVIQILVILLLIDRHGLLAIGIAALVNAGFTVIVFLPVSIRRYRQTPKLTGSVVGDTIPEEVLPLVESSPDRGSDPSMYELAQQVSERSLWLDTEKGPIFARLTTPLSGVTRGGILISPPIGSEGRVARRTFRTLATTMAAEGYSVLRFDHFGTGDSGGSLEEEDFLTHWTDQIAQGVDYLRALGCSEVSAVGMRLGATILGASASRNPLKLESMVLWDPCVTGRAYLRERAALEATRPQYAIIDPANPYAASEFVFSDKTKEKIGSLSLLDATPEQLADRVLIIMRNDRVTPSALAKQFDSRVIAWETTSEQSSLIEKQLPTSELPEETISRIGDWLQTTGTPVSPLVMPDLTVTATVGGDDGRESVRERLVSLGPAGLFAVVCEPLHARSGPFVIHKGPLMVMVNGMNEDHWGPSRLWVDLSRKWASEGFRCVRFDSDAQGESGWPEDASSKPEVQGARVVDICDVVRALCPEDPSDAVLVGLCSGAQQALDAALELRARGLCSVNPQVGRAIVQYGFRLHRSNRSIVRSLGARLRSRFEGHRWIWKLVWQLSRILLPNAFSFKVRRQLVDNGTKMLLIASLSDIRPFPRVPILRSFDERRLVSSALCQINIVTGLDHDFMNIDARARAVAIVDSFVMGEFSSQNPRMRSL